MTHYYGSLAEAFLSVVKDRAGKGCARSQHDDYPKTDIAVVTCLCSVRISCLVAAGRYPRCRDNSVFIKVGNLHGSCRILKISPAVFACIVCFLTGCGAGGFHSFRKSQLMGQQISISFTADSTNGPLCTGSRSTCMAVASFSIFSHYKELHNSRRHYT